MHRYLLVDRYRGRLVPDSLLFHAWFHRADHLSVREGVCMDYEHRHPVKVKTSSLWKSQKKG